MSPPEMPAMPPAPPPPPVFGDQTKPNKKPQMKSMQPTFLGTGSVPTQSQLGTKTLLGQ